MGSNNSYDKIKERIDDLVAGITRCYILLNYAYNADEKTELYKVEFKKRYINFFREINEIDQIINYNHYAEIGVEIKKILNLEFYISKMNFLNPEKLEDEAEEPNPKIDKEYEVKTTIRTVKLNFYHNNKYEFGPKTRLHVNPIEYGIINPYPNNVFEEKYIFSALTEFYKSNYFEKETESKKPKLLNKTDKKNKQ